MKNQNIKLINILSNTTILSAKTLADKMGVSIRSVKNYVKEINAEYPNAILSSRYGYTVNNEITQKILKLDCTHIPQTSDERVTFIINELIHHNGSNKVIDMYDLCDEMYISLSTLKNELTKVKRKLSKYDLKLITANSLINVDGLEKNKRKLLSSILYDESNVNFINLESLQKAFTDIDVFEIKIIIEETLNKYKYFVNDYSLMNLILHTTIAIDRIRNNYITNDILIKKPSVCLHEYDMALEMSARIEDKFSIKFTPTEIYEMCLLIISRATNIDFKSINENNIEDFIGKECLEIVNKLVQDINKYYYINISEPEFLIRFALHIRNLIVRAKNNYFSKNPLTENIKTSCPLIYDASVILANGLSEKTGIKINDDEIAYIAFHLGSTIGEQKILAEKISTVLYCPNYYDMNLKLLDNIKKYFSNELLITNILTDECELSKLHETDLILTTIPISIGVHIPIQTINFYFTEKDKNNLNNKIIEIQTNKRKSLFEKRLRTLIIPEFFNIKKGFFDRDSCIDYMIDNMISNGYVTNSFKDEILYRESISSTAFGKFAIPHAMKMNALKTGMNIVITEEPLDWGEYKINLIIMLSFNNNERYIFNEIFEPITMILSDSENIRKIISCKTYDEFINTMVYFFDWR